jgi:hypothetical protein
MATSETASIMNVVVFMQQPQLPLLTVHLLKGMPVAKKVREKDEGGERFVCEFLLNAAVHRKLQKLRK